MSRFEIVSETVTAELAKPYEYGVADCFMMGLEVVDAIRGTSHRKAYLGRYSTYPDAHKVLKKDGFKTLADLLRDKIGLTEIGFGTATVGDIALVSVGDGRDHVSVFTGGLGFLTKTESGPEKFGTEYVKICFRV